MIVRLESRGFGILVQFFLRMSHDELPPIPSCAFSHPKDDLANVLDVGLLLCLVRAIPLRHNFALHRLLDYGVVVGEGLFVVLRLLL